MNAWFWIAVILTSPFWMVLGIVVAAYIFGILGMVLIAILSLFEEFFKLFRRKK